MLQSGVIAVLLFCCVHPILANVEKTIFIGPTSSRIPIHPTIDDYLLPSLNPRESNLRTQLLTAPPSNSSSSGISSWFLLEGLAAGQRYEVRICWAATQPTAFQLSTYELTEVFQSPILITSLAEHSKILQPASKLFEEISDVSAFKKYEDTINHDQSVLFLQILAAADYYTTNRTLMENDTLVLVDIILDPYLFNILPQSLIPTAIYISTLAICSWYLSRYISDFIRGVAQKDDGKKKV